MTTPFYSEMTTDVTRSNVTELTNGSLGNQTSDDEPAYFVYFTYIYRALYGVGITGNLLSFLVWQSSGLHFSTVIYFQAICIADSLALVLHLLEKFHGVHVQGVCQLIHVFFLADQVCAIFLVLGLSAERFVELVLPLKAKKLLSPKRTVHMVLLTAILSILFSGGEAYVWHVQIEVGQCQVRHVLSQTLMMIYAILVLAFLFVLPLVLVLLFNFLMHYKVSCRRKNSAAFSVAMVPDKHNLTLSVAIVSCYLAVCEIIYAGVHTHQYFSLKWEGLDNSTDFGEGEIGDKPITGRWHNYHLNTLPLLIADVVALSAYAVDVAIFTLFSKTFRRKAHELYGRCRRRCPSLHPAAPRPPPPPPPIPTASP